MKKRLKKDLWLRIRNYHFDNLVPPHLADHVIALFGRHDASTHAFAAKLAAKRGWATSFALRAIAEYKKFVYLGVTSDTPVTPSKHVDQVWHQHLLFTKAYREFCDTVLERAFDHHPELVPMDAQTDVFSEQYEDTLRLYVAEFNTLPPKDIWGTPKFPLAVQRDPKARRHVKYADATGQSVDSTPLYLSFVGGDGGSGSDFSEFGGGGGFSGGGGGDSWGGGHDGGSSAGSDSTSSDGGGGDSGGSGCSSSCGGGGCGGGGGD